MGLLLRCYATGILNAFLEYHRIRCIYGTTDELDDVTVTLNATETNTDEALFAVNVTSGTPVTTAGDGARVSIIEVAPDGDNAATSFIEG